MMRQTGKALSKKLFGARYESLKRALFVWPVVFLGLYLSGIRIQIAPSVRCLAVFSLSAGIMWRLLTSEGTTGDMQHLFMLPICSRSFVLSYVLLLGAYTLLTKTAGLLAVMLAVCPCRKTEVLGVLLCAGFAVLVTACFYALMREKAVSMPCRKKALLFVAYLIPRIMSAFWPAAFLTAILLQPDPTVFLTVIAGGSLHAAIILWNIDAYTFYGGNNTHSRRVRSGRHALPWRYLVRYLLSRKSYMLNTLVLWGIACVLPVFFARADSSLARTDGSFMLPIGFAVLSLNTPICILLSGDPSLGQALRFLPHQGKMFLVPYCLFIFLCSLSTNAIFLCSYALQDGGVHASMGLSAAAFALLGAIGSTLLEWFFPLRGWKTENDLWHHPRKYIVPAALLLLAGIVRIW